MDDQSSRRWEKRVYRRAHVAGFDVSTAESEEQENSSGHAAMAGSASACRYELHNVGWQGGFLSLLCFDVHQQNRPHWIQPAKSENTLWGMQVMQSLQIDEVPGMGQFDIDGVDAEDRSNLYGDALAVMSFAVVIILSFGLSFAWVLSKNFTGSYDMDPHVMQLLSDM